MSTAFTHPAKPSGNVAATKSVANANGWRVSLRHDQAGYFENTIDESQIHKSFERGRDQPSFRWGERVTEENMPDLYPVERDEKEHQEFATQLYHFLMEQGLHQPEDLPPAVAIPRPRPPVSPVAPALYPVDEEELLTLQRTCHVPRDVAFRALQQHDNIVDAILDLTP